MDDCSTHRCSTHRCSTEGLLALHARKIPDSRLEQLKVVAYGLGVSKVDLRERSVFNDVIACITAKLGQEKEAITFAYNVLELLDYHVEEHIIPEPEYGDVRLKYPEIDLRLTVTNLVKDLEEKDYEILLSYVCSKSGVSTDGIKSRWDLVNLMFDELMESPEDIALVCEVCDVFNRKRLILDYCSRQEKEKPEFVVSVHQMSQDQQESFYEFYGRQEQKTQELEELETENREEKQCCTCITCFTVLDLVLLALVVLAGTATTLGLAFNSDSSQESINVTDSSVVSIKPDGFKDNLDHIELTLVSEDESIELNVYKERCDNVPKLMNNLPPHHIPQLYSILKFKRQAYNYRGQDNPIYGLEGSFLVFNLSATGSNSTDPGCLRIQIFNNYNYYFDATNPGEDNTTQVDGVVDHSPCLPVGTSGSSENSSWRYTFDRPQYVYATVDEGKMVQIDGSISGYIVNYSLGSLSPVCQLTTQSRTSRTCNVNVCGKTCSKRGSPTQCLFVQIQSTDSPSIKQTEIIYTMISPRYSQGFFSSVGSFSSVSLLLLLLVLILVLVICKLYVCPRLCSSSFRRKNVPPYQRQSSDFSNSDAFLLGNDSN